MSVLGEEPWTPRATYSSLNNGHLIISKSSRIFIGPARHGTGWPWLHYISKLRSHLSSFYQRTNYTQRKKYRQPREEIKINITNVFDSGGASASSTGIRGVFIVVGLYRSSSFCCSRKSIRNPEDNSNSHHM